MSGARGVALCGTDGASGHLNVREQTYFWDFTNPLMGSPVPLSHAFWLSLVVSGLGGEGRRGGQGRCPQTGGHPAHSTWASVRVACPPPFLPPACTCHSRAGRGGVGLAPGPLGRPPKSRRAETAACPSARPGAPTSRARPEPSRAASSSLCPWSKPLSPPAGPL